MNYVITINDVPVSASQLNIVTTIDKTLDYGSFVVRNKTASAYDVGTLVDIDATDGTTTLSYHFIVSADEVETLPNGVYIHSVDIIELTKILEWQTDSTRTFTQLATDKLTVFDLIIRLQATLPIARVSALETTRPFAVESGLRTRLLGIEAPEFVFNNKNLKEMLFDIFDFVGAIPRLARINGVITLVADFFNERGTLVTEQEFGRMERFNLDGFSVALDADIKNLFNEYTEITDPAPNGFKRLTAKDGDFREDSAFLKTDYPIVEIISLKCKTDIKPRELPKIENFTIDLTNVILEKSDWENLTNAPALSSYDTPYRDNTLFYERFKANIDNLFEPVGALRGVSIIPGNPRIHQALRRALLLADTGYQLSTFEDFFELEFQIVYRARIDSRTEVKRLDTRRIKFASSSYTGQTDNIVRSDRVLDRLFKLQQQLGNAEFMTTERTKLLSNVYQLGDFNSSDYIITTTELQFEKDYVIAKYLWSQNYQKVSDFIALNSEIRLYLTNDDAFTRNIYLEDFVEVGPTSIANNSDVKSAGIATFMNTFSNSPTSGANTPLQIIGFDNNETPSVVSTEIIVKPVTTYAGGNSINVHMEFDDPKVAGWQLSIFGEELDIELETNEDEDEAKSLLQRGIDFITGLVTTVVTFFQKTFRSIFKKPISKAVFYTDNVGEVFDVSFTFRDGVTIATPRNLPIVPRTALGTELIGGGPYRIYKDLRERLAITYALHVRPAPNFEKKIVIGKYVTERNNLLKSILTTSNQFEVFSSTLPYEIHQNQFSKATDVVVAQTYSISGNLLALSSAVSGTGIVAWGIRKKTTKELIIAVNDLTITQLYFNFLDRQSNVIYPSEFSTPVIRLFRVSQLAATPPPTGTRIDVVWTDPNSPNATQYRVEITNDNETFVTKVVTTNTTFFDNLTGATTYTIRVRAETNENFSEWAYLNVTTLSIAPNAPINVTATLIGDRRVFVQWEDDQDVLLYRIEASTVSNFATLITGGLRSAIAPNTFTTFDFINSAITYNTQYFFRVRGLRGLTFSVNSSSATVTTPESPLTSAPSITNVTISGSNVTFTLINTDDQLVTLFADFVNGTTSRATGVRPNEAKTFTLAFTTETTIFAKAKATLKSDSPVVTQVFAPDSPPAAPNIGATAIVTNPGFNVVNFTYETTDPIVDGFVVERNPDTLNASQFGEVSQQLPPTARRFIDLNRVLSGQSYTYRVRAINRLGTTLSNERTVTSQATVPNAPSSLAASVVLAGAPGEGFFILTWQRNSTDEIGFLVERKLSTQGEGSYAVVGGTSKGQVTIDQTIVGDPNTTYNYRIIAYNDFGNSAPSNVVSVLIE